MSSFWTGGAKYRKYFIMAADFFLFSMSYFVSWFMMVRRPDVVLSERIDLMLIGYCVFVIVFFLSFWLFGMYESLWRYAEAYEFLKCMYAIAVAVVVFMFATWLIFINHEYRIPLTVYFVSGTMAGAGALYVRTAYRAYRSTLHQKGAKNRKKMLIVGAGEMGAAVIQGLERSPFHRFEVVCAVDDDPAKRGRRIRQVTVAGTTNDIPRLTERHGVQVILMAISHATGKEKRRISSICAKTKCELKKIPDFLDFEENAQSLEAEVVSRIEDFSLEDLLGRDVVDVKRFRQKFLAGQVVMVTGAGGTIGSELCRQAAAHGASRLVMVDVVENGLYEIQQELIYKFRDLNLVAEVANIREEARVDALFAEYKPNLVYHAAAHKHVPLMESAPEEAVKNNIFGTLNIARAADLHGVKRFVLISSDKAVNPTNVYGATKRVCEMIVQTMNAESATEFTAVRFGNVLGSNGSVVPLFKAQIASGGPVRVMHKEIIRYFMTVSEAVSLVMSAGEMARGGEIFVLDMGDPVKILDLAEMLIRLSGLEPYKDINIEITGLRPGEKLYEELLMSEEGMKTTSNNKIFIGSPIDIRPKYLFEALDTLKKAVHASSRDALVCKLKEMVPGFENMS
ncbi:MAG: polysaccharide biosynthesis protein [Defluviitaleaceae bacterium]|nr:polysaccharide biosynthesis protein [Defluviitaleaceae bacterium]